MGTARRRGGHTYMYSFSAISGRELGLHWASVRWKRRDPGWKPEHTTVATLVAIAVCNTLHCQGDVTFGERRLLAQSGMAGWWTPKGLRQNPLKGVGCHFPLTAGTHSLLPRYTHRKMTRLVILHSSDFFTRQLLFRLIRSRYSCLQTTSSHSP